MSDDKKMSRKIKELKRREKIRLLKYLGFEKITKGYLTRLKQKDFKRYIGLMFSLKYLKRRGLKPEYYYSINGVSYIMTIEYMEQCTLDEIKKTLLSVFASEESFVNKLVECDFTEMNFSPFTGEKLHETCPNCWVKNQPYNCGFEVCPGKKLMIEEMKEEKGWG